MASVPMPEPSLEQVIELGATPAAVVLLVAGPECLVVPSQHIAVRSVLISPIWVREQLRPAHH